MQVHSRCCTIVHGPSPGASSRPPGLHSKGQKAQTHAPHTLKMVLLMMSEWMAATPLTALLPTTARYAMFTSLHGQTSPQHPTIRPENLRILSLGLPWQPVCTGQHAACPCFVIRLDLSSSIPFSGARISHRAPLPNSVPIKRRGMTLKPDIRLSSAASQEKRNQLAVDESERPT